MELELFHRIARYISYFRCSLSTMISIAFKYQADFSIIPSMSYVFMFGDINIYLHRQWNGGLIDIGHL